MREWDEIDEQMEREAHALRGGFSSSTGYRGTSRRQSRVPNGPQHRARRSRFGLDPAAVAGFSTAAPAATGYWRRSPTTTTKREKTMDKKALAKLCADLVTKIQGELACEESEGRMFLGMLLRSNATVIAKAAAKPGTRLAVEGEVAVS